MPNKGSKGNSGLQMPPSKSSAKAKRRRRRRRAGRAQARELMPGGLIPRSQWKFIAAGEDSLRVRGREPMVLATVKTSPTELVSEIFNPASAVLLPRLSSIAGVFQEYCLHRLSFSYHTLAPGVRSGSVGVVMTHDPTKAVPATILGYSAYECSGAGSVGQNWRSSEWRPRDDKVYYTDSGTISSDVGTKSPGRIAILSDLGLAADSGAPGGVVMVEYDVTLYHPKPQAPSVLQFTAEPSQTFDGANAASQFIAGDRNDEPGVSKGSWDFDAIGRLVRLTSAAGRVYSTANSILSGDFSDKTFDWYVKLGSVFSPKEEKKDFEPDDPFEGRGSGLVVQWAPSSGYSLKSGSLYLLELVSKDNPRIRSYLAQVSECLSTSPEEVKDPSKRENWPRLPNVAGDFDIEIWSLLNDGGSDVLEAFESYSLGTGSHNISGNYGYSGTTNYEDFRRFAIGVHPEGTEKRTSQAGGYVGVDNLADDYFSLASKTKFHHAARR